MTAAAALVHRADCADCDWTATGTWAEVDRAAERHARTGHAVVSLTLPPGKAS